MIWIHPQMQWVSTQGNGLRGQWLAWTRHDTHRRGHLGLFDAQGCVQPGAAPSHGYGARVAQARWAQLGCTRLQYPVPPPTQAARGHRLSSRADSA